MFGIIWLNTHNLAGYLGRDYKGIEAIVLFMGIAKLIDLGTGANTQIIGTSSYWKVDFTTNVIYTLIALPLNYILIAHYGLLGAAYSTLISMVVYNSMRFGFLWFKFSFQPYSGKTLLALLIATICIIIVYFIPRFPSVVADATMRSAIFLILFVPAIYLARISEEINVIVRNMLSKVGIGRNIS
jgi:O-antigen/teichoic acid export membrane protein